jgi:hypothetical protein
VRKYQIAPGLIMGAAESISSHMAAGDDILGYRELLPLHRGRFERRRVIDYLVARGHLERLSEGDFRPIRDGELL